MKHKIGELVYDGEKLGIIVATYHGNYSVEWLKTGFRNLINPRAISKMKVAKDKLLER